MNNLEETEAERAIRLNGGTRSVAKMVLCIQHAAEIRELRAQPFMPAWAMIGVDGSWRQLVAILNEEADAGEVKTEYLVCVGSGPYPPATYLDRAQALVEFERQVSSDANYLGSGPRQGQLVEKITITKVIAESPR